MNDDNKDIDIKTDETIISGLLNEFKVHRDSLYIMIEELEKIKENIEKLFPENLDKRYLMYFQEKVKAVTGLFSSLLDMRKEISKSLKDEIDLRRKTMSRNEDDDFEEMLDIRSIADKVKNFEKEKEKRKDKIEKILEKNSKEGLKMVEK